VRVLLRLQAAGEHSVLSKSFLVQPSPSCNVIFLASVIPFVLLIQL